MREAAPLMGTEQDLLRAPHLFYLPARLEVLVRLPFLESQKVRDRDRAEGVLLREAAAVEEDGASERRAHHRG